MNLNGGSASSNYSVINISYDAFHACKAQFI